MGAKVAGAVRNEGIEADAAIERAKRSHGEAVVVGTPDYSATEALEPYALAEAAKAGRLPGYSGPMEMEGFGALSAQAQQAQESAKLATTPAGRATLLGRLYSSYNPTAGGAMLDSALVGRGAGAELPAIGARFGTLSQRAAQAGQEAREQSASAKKSTEEKIAGYGALPPPAAAPSAPTPAAQQAAKPRPSPQPPGNQLGNTFVPAGPPGKSQIIGNTPIQAPQAPKRKGGQWIAGQWVPYT